MFNKNNLVKEFTEKFKMINEKMVALRVSLNENQLMAYDSKMNELIRLRKRREKLTWFFTIIWGMITIASIGIAFVPGIGAGAASTGASVNTVGITAMYGLTTKAISDSITKTEVEISNMLNQWERSIDFVSKTLVNENTLLQKTLNEYLMGTDFEAIEENEQ